LNVVTKVIISPYRGQIVLISVSALRGLMGDAARGLAPLMSLGPAPR